MAYYVELGRTRVPIEPRKQKDEHGNRIFAWNTLLITRNIPYRQRSLLKRFLTLVSSTVAIRKEGRNLAVHVVPKAVEVAGVKLDRRYKRQRLELKPGQQIKIRPAFEDRQIRLARPHKRDAVGTTLKIVYKKVA